MKENCQEWHNTISKDKVGRISTSKCKKKNTWTPQKEKKHVLGTMFILEYSLVDLNFEKKLEEQLKNEKNPWRTTM